MNKYTLSFRSACLEQKYQDHRFISTIPACKAINLMCLFVCVLRSIISLIVVDYLNLFIFMPLGVFVLIVHFVVISYKKHWIDLYLVCINHILMLYQIYCEDEFLAEEAFVFGQNMMCMHIIIILVSDYKYAVIQVIMGGVIKLTIGGYFQPSISFQAYIYTTVLSFILLFTLHRTNKQYRESFLYTTNNNSIDWIIPTVIKNPFALFSFDQENLGFQIRISNFESHQLFDPSYNNIANLNHLIRNFSIFGQTLEQFLLQRQKSYQEPQTNKALQIYKTKNHSEKIMVKYSEIFVTNLIFVIIIDQQEQEFQKLQASTTRLEKGASKFIQNIRTFLRKELQLIDRQSVHFKQQLYKSKLNILYVLSKLQINQLAELESFNLVHKVKQFAILFHQAYSKKIQTSFPQSIEIKTYKRIFEELMTILMIYLHRQSSDNIQIKLYTSFQQHIEHVDIHLILDKPSKLQLFLSKNTHFCSTLRLIGPLENALFVNRIIIIRLYKDLTNIVRHKSFLKERFSE